MSILASSTESMSTRIPSMQTTLSPTRTCPLRAAAPFGISLLMV